MLLWRLSKWGVWLYKYKESELLISKEYYRYHWTGQSGDGGEQLRCRYWTLKLILITLTPTFWSRAGTRIFLGAPLKTKQIWRLILRIQKILTLDKVENYNVLLTRCFNSLKRLIKQLWMIPESKLPKSGWIGMRTNPIFLHITPFVYTGTFSWNSIQMEKNSRKKRTILYLF